MLQLQQFASELCSVYIREKSIIFSIIYFLSECKYNKLEII